MGGPVTVSVHQPNFLPWLKLLDKILASDVFVAYDTVQYTRSEYHSRQKIKYESGATWLSVPLTTGSNTLIRDARIDNKQPFRGRQLKRIRVSYGRSPFFDEVYPIVERAYRGRQEFLVDLSLELIHGFCEYLGSDVRIVRASELEHSGDNAERIVALVRGAGGSVHLTSTFGSDRDYIDWPAVARAGIGIRSQEFTHPVYEQPFGGEFLPHLSALDMLFARGRATADELAARRRFVDVTPAAVGG